MDKIEETNSQVTPETLFGNNRQNLVIEIGHAGAATVYSSEVRSNLEMTDTNYLGIDINSNYVQDLKTCAEQMNYDWAKSIEANIMSGIPVLENHASEVWIANFKELGINGVGIRGKPNEREFTNKFFKKVSALLKPGGKIVFMNDFDDIGELGLSVIIQELGNEYSVNKIILGESSPPFIESHKRLYQDEKLKDSYARRFKGFIATKIIKP